MTPSQAAQLPHAMLRAERAIDRLRARDPSWQPPAQAFDPRNVDGLIRSYEFVARQADARFRQFEQSAGIGHNGGPAANPQLPRNNLPSLPGELIATYRAIVGMPDNSTITRKPPSAAGTIAHARIDGQDFYGVNSGSSAFTQRDDALAREMRDRLIVETPDLMQTLFSGQMPNNAAFHAEANLLLRAADQYGGALRGRWIDMTVDRNFCKNCQVVLPEIALRLGNPRVRIRDRRGEIFEIRDGVIQRNQLNDR